MSDFRELPAVDRVLDDPALHTLIADLGVRTVRNALRELQADVRRSGSLPDWAKEPAAYAPRLAAQLCNAGYVPIFNLTGTTIHTNLGRALLSDRLLDEVRPLLTRPTNLEFDLAKGKRGQRDNIVQSRLKTLTGCEAATVVNNNAAALMLVLNTFALNKPVPVSRGELIEIGGSFRLPELMARSGAILNEVGTTNRTHEKDYAAALDDAAMLLKVHPSNYQVSGFTKEVDAGTLARLAKQADIPSCVDLGSGTLVDLAQWGLPKEPTPQSMLERGIDLVTFSGDKLLGGVQAGIIVGRKDLIAEINANPLKRALRADKFTLTMLAAVLRQYEQPEHLNELVPTLRTLTLPEQTLQTRAETVAASLSAPWTTEIAACEGQIGSGALPDKTHPSVAVTLTHPEHKPDVILSELRKLSTPVIGRIADEKVWLDMRGADPVDELVSVLSELQ